MVFRVAYVSLAIAYIFSIVASVCAQTTSVTNPNFQPEVRTSSQIDPAVKPAGEFKPDSLLADFEPFVPQSAEVLILHRPKQLFENKALGTLVQALDVASRWLPTEPNQIELLMVAASHKTIGKITNARAEEAFADIAEQIAAINPDHKREKRNKPSLANLLNTDFAGLIRFAKPIDWQDLATWLDKKNDRYGKYKSAKWKGDDILDCGSADCCVVIRLDPRTFVISNKRQLRRSAESKRTANPVVTQWLQKLDRDDFQGEYFIGTDMRVYENAWAQIMPQTGPWSKVDKIEALQFRLDLHRTPLVMCQFDFTDSTTAAEFKQQIEKAFRDELAKRRDELKLDENNNSLHGWATRQAQKMAESLTFYHDDKSVQASVPRPDNFDQLTSALVTRLNQYETKQKSQFDAIASQLDAAGNESDSGASEAFNEIARDLEAAGSNQAATKVGTRALLILKKDIEPGEVIRRKDLTVELWRRDLVPEDALTNSKWITGKKAKQHLLKGQPVLQDQVESEF